MPGLECVTEAEVRAYLQGDLPEQSSEIVARHLDVCPECEAVARRLDGKSDPMIRAIRRMASPDFDSNVATPPDPHSTPLPEAVPPVSATAPRRIADYDVLEVLGQGGMSVVYKGRQAHPDRFVALKMLLAGSHAGPERRARLLAEADAIARLRHAHIVQIHEVGEQDGVPFLSLEHVSGGSLAEKLKGAPQPPKEAATLVEALARAVAHAHDNGVVHRDLKPANVLLTPEGAPKITDFGLARHERPEMTDTNAMLGTPSYMAPEQAAGDNRAVGPAADIYALGAILYETLTGRPPFRGATALETLEQVRTQEPVPPSRLQPRLARDLDTIVLKCLAKQPARRYATAADLADDLHRYLTNQPIRARPTPPWERFSKWARRRPLATSLLAVTLLAAASLLGVWASFTVRLQTERNRANANADERDRQRREADEQRGRAEANEDRAFEGIDRFLTRVGDKKLASLPGMDEVRKEVLVDALALCQEVLRQPGSSARARSQVAQAHQRCVRIYAALGESARAHEHLQQAIQGHRQLAGDFPEEPSHRYELSKDLHNLAVMYEGSRQLAQSEKVRKEVVGLRKQLVADRPDHDDYRAALARAYDALALVWKRRGRLIDAQKGYDDALAILEDLHRSHPGSSLHARDLANTLSHLGMLHYARNNLKAEQAWARGRDVLESVRKGQPADSQIEESLARMYDQLGVVYLANNRPQLGLSAGQTALALKQELARRHRSIPGYRSNLAAAYNNLARTCDQLGSRAKAEEYFEAACKTVRELASDHPTTANRALLAKYCSNLGIVLLQHRKPEAALAPIKEAVAVLTPLVAARADDASLALELGRAQTTLAQQLLDTTDPIEPALACNEKAILALEGALQRENGHREVREFLARAQGQRAIMLGVAGRHAETLVCWERVRQLGCLTSARWQLWRTLTLAHLGKWTEASRDATDITAKLRLPAEVGELYPAACVYTCIAEAIARDSSLGLAERVRREVDCENRAVTLLSTCYVHNLGLPPADVEKWHPTAKRDAEMRMLRRVAGTSRFVFLMARAYARDANGEQRPTEATKLDRLALAALRHARAQGHFRTPAQLRQLQSEPDLKRLHHLPEYKALVAEAEKTVRR